MDSSIDLLALILYDIHQWKTVEKSYKNYEKLCELLGKRAIPYDGYEYLYNKYLKESCHPAKNRRDLLISHIRGCILSDVVNGKSAEKSIDDLCDAFKNCKIDKEYHLKTYFKLRDVSYGFRTILDQLTPPCTEIYVNCRDEFIEIVPKNVFSIHSSGSRWSYSICSTSNTSKLTNKGLEHLLKNPKLRLKSAGFSIDTGAIPFRMLGRSGYKRPFFDFLNSLNHKIHVEHCSISTRNEEDLVSVLKCLKPGTLKKLDICNGFLNYSINKIVEMDQWKRAKNLKLIGFSLPSIEHLLHFTTIETDFQRFSDDGYIELGNVFSKSINFKSFTMGTTEWDAENIKRVLNVRGISGVYSIPGSNLVIEFLLDSTVLELRKNIV